ncbi:MAG: efflux RND transporter periplasmic adaptor subunit, partial [Vicingaceae bacterium]
NRLNQNEKTLNEYNIQAKAKGKVYQLFKEAGELINPQEPFGEIGSNGHYKITMDIDEVDITKLELGDTAIIRLDAYPEREFTARIQKIYPKKDPTTLTFKVEGQFVNPPPKLYNGLAGEANVIVGRHQNVITIPTEYLKSPNTVLTENGEQAIEIGLNNLEFVEVISGIDTSTALIKPENE